MLTYPVTDFLAQARASSKCFLVMTGTGSSVSSMLASPSGFSFIKAFLCSSASIDSLIAALVDLWHNSVRSAPVNPSVNSAKNSKVMFGATGLFLKTAFSTYYLDGLSGKGI
jgi:hypothetical protein